MSVRTIFGFANNFWSMTMEGEGSSAVTMMVAQFDSLMPNGLQVIITLEALGIPYEIKSKRFEEIKKSPFVDVNPDGRAPGLFLVQ